MANNPDHSVVLDVGHGNAAVIRSRGITMIIDTGIGSALLEYLRQETISRVSLVLLSHADEDHVGGLVGLLAAGTVRVDEIRLNPDGTKDTRTWDDLQALLDAQQSSRKITYNPGGLSSGADPISCGSATIDIIGPSPYLAGKGVGGTDRSGRRIRSNSLSVVFLVRASNRPRLLLAGDLDRIGFDELAYKAADLQADTLVFPHHGGKSGGDDRAFAKDLVSAVRPRRVVFSLARRRSPNNPAPDVVDGVRQARPVARIMCTQLSQQCASTIGSGNTSHLASTFSHGRASGACCAGTVVVRHLATRCVTTPSMAAHRRYLTVVAQTPLCR